MKIGLLPTWVDNRIRIIVDLGKEGLTFSLPYMTEISVVIRRWT